MTSVRKFYLTLFACSFLTFSAVAQLSLGLRGGINVAEYSFKDNGTNLDQESITGFTFGGLLEIGLGGNIFLQPEFIYTQKGSQLEVLNEENKFNVNYLDIPVLLKIKIINADLFNLNLLGGPSFGLALNGEESRAGQTVDINFGGE
ncbi:MAG: porin family protein, partial [Bacteroidota bacterium]